MQPSPFQDQLLLCIANKRIEFDSSNNDFPSMDSGNQIPENNHENMNESVLEFLDELCYANVWGFEDEEGIFVNSYHYLDVWPIHSI